jgi:hypothetical protein
MLYHDRLAQAQICDLDRAWAEMSRSAEIRGENLEGTERAASLAPDRRHLARLAGGRNLSWDLRRSGAA